MRTLWRQNDNCVGIHQRMTHPGLDRGTKVTFLNPCNHSWVFKNGQEDAAFMAFYSFGIG